MFRRGELASPMERTATVNVFVSRAGDHWNCTSALTRRVKAKERKEKMVALVRVEYTADEGGDGYKLHAIE